MRALAGVSRELLRVRGEKMDGSPLIQIIFALLSLSVSAIGAFVGVRIAVARLEVRFEERLSAIEKSIVGLDLRVQRLEAPYFSRPQSLK